MARFQAANEEYLRRNRQLIRMYGSLYPGHPAPHGHGGGPRAVAGRADGGGGHDHPRRVRGLRRLPRHAALADDRARLGGEHLRARRGLHGPHRRDPGRRRRRSRDRGARCRSTTIRGDVELRDLTFAYDGTARAARHRPRGARRLHGGHRGPHRLRQEHARRASSRASSRRRRAPCSWTATTCATCPWPRCAGPSASCPQETFLFSETVGENVAFGLPADADRERARALGGGGGAARPRTWPTSRKGSRPSWASAASRSPAGRSSAPPSRAPWPSTRPSSSSTTPSPPWTRRRRRTSCAALRGVMATRTTFLVSHRVSTVKDADLIVVLRGGPHRGAGHPRRAGGARRLLRGPAPAAAPRRGDGEDGVSKPGFHEDDPVDKSYDRTLLRRLLRYLRPLQAARGWPRSCSSWPWPASTSWAPTSPRSPSTSYIRAGQRRRPRPHRRPLPGRAARSPSSCASARSTSCR